MKLTAFPPIISRFPKRHAMAAVAMASLTCLAGVAHAAVLTFTPGTPIVTTTYAGLTVGNSITDIGWTGAAAPAATSPTYILGATPRGTGYGGSSPVIEATPGARRLASSPEVTGLPEFKGGDTVYFSAWVNRIGSQSSGARVALRTVSASYVGGFGIVDTKPSGMEVGNTFAIGVTIWSEDDQPSLKWIYSEEQAKANHWYEMALVVEVDPVDITLSLGSVFVRDATAGETEFRPVEGLTGITMGFTEDRNLNQFTYWRLEGFQNSVQLGSLSVGKVAAIPEPSTASLQLAAAVLLFGVPGVLKWFAGRRD
ncbi:MAG TPA: hypothetical protein VNQ90_06455 [Chthoniobacteraceae bacterium]|nr:hypothetical protein [Chthoniobacteraceae bacterium]